MMGRNFAGVIPSQNTFREDVRARPPPLLECASHDLLGVAQAINRCGIDPVHAELEGLVDRGDRIVVVLRAPCILPVATPDSPGAKANWADAEIGVSEFLTIHGSLCMRTNRP